MVIEKGRPLSKVQISRRGRCNVTNGHYTDAKSLAEHYPRAIKNLGAFSSMITVQWIQCPGFPIMELNSRLRMMEGFFLSTMLSMGKLRVYIKNHFFIFSFPVSIFVVNSTSSMTGTVDDSNSDVSILIDQPNESALTNAHSY